MRVIWSLDIHILIENHLPSPEYRQRKTKHPHPASPEEPEEEMGSGRSSAKLAVWPWMKFLFPMGPSSPAAKNPATGVCGIARRAALTS